MATQSEIHEALQNQTSVIGKSTRLGDSMVIGVGEPIRWVQTQWKKEETRLNGLPKVTYTSLEKGRDCSVEMTYTSIWGGKFSGHWQRNITSHVSSDAVPAIALTLPVRQAQFDRENDLSVALREQMDEIIEELKEYYPERQIPGFPPIG